MKKDINWLKEEMSTEVHGLCWEGKLETHHALYLLNRLHCLIEQFHSSQNEKPHKWKDSPTEVVGRQDNMLRFRTAQITNDSIRKAFEQYREILGEHQR